MLRVGGDLKKLVQLESMMIKLLINRCRFDTHYRAKMNLFGKTAWY